MERNGFTLAELMGVIVILAILAIVIVPVVDKNLKKGRSTTCKTQEKSILEAAQNYNSDNITLCENKGQTCEITVKELVGNGYLEGSSTTDDTPPINPGTDEPYDNSTYVQITNITGYNYSYDLMYEGKDRGSCQGE